MKSKRKIPKTFIGFLLASVLIWLLITLSKEYTISIIFPIKYTNIAQNKLLLAAQTKELEIVVKANGFKILKTRFNTKSIAIEGNAIIKKKGTKHYLLIKSQKQNILKQMPSGIFVEEIIKDTLFLDVGSLVSKKLPIKANVKVNYHIGFDLSEEIVLKPDSLIVSGPENFIADLKEIALLPLELNDVKENFSRNVGIKMLGSNKNLKFNIKEVAISGKVEKFTEGSFEVDYKITNVPKGLVLNTLTKKIRVTYIIGLSNFNKVDENSFLIECDYSISEANNLSYLIPKLMHKPAEIKSYKLLPNEINFLIQN